MNRKNSRKSRNTICKDVDLADNTGFRKKLYAELLFTYRRKHRGKRKRKHEQENMIDKYLVKRAK